MTTHYNNSIGLWIRNLFCNQIIVLSLEVPIIEQQVENKIEIAAPTEKKKPIRINRFESWRDLRARVEPTLKDRDKKARDRTLKNQSEKK